MGELAAEVPATGGDDQLLVMIGGIIVAALGTISAVAVAAINNRKNAQTPPATVPVGNEVQFRDYVIGELAVGRVRNDDSDDRDELQDRQLEQVFRVLDQVLNALGLDPVEWRRH